MTEKNTEFKVSITQGECNGYMKSQWFANGQLLTKVVPTSTDPVILEFKIILPCTIKVILSGKNPNTDTKVNDQGQIIQDKFIKINQMWLARHPIPEHLYMDMIKLTTSHGDTIQTPFLGFSGEAQWTFDAADPIVWHLQNNHYKVS